MTGAVGQFRPSVPPFTAQIGGAWAIREGSSTDAAIRVFCLPSAGGSAAAYRGWAGAAPRLDVVAVELPGHGRRITEPPVATMAGLVRAVAHGIGPLLHDLPYVLFGHSMGGLVAFELARELRRRRLPLPKHVVVSAVAAPTAHPGSGRGRREWSDGELIEEMRRLGGTPEALLREPELLDLLLPILRADLTLCAHHRFVDEPALPCPITALGGRDDPTVAPDALFSWARHTTAGFARIVVPGGHFYLDAQRRTVLDSLVRSPAEPWPATRRDAAG